MEILFFYKLLVSSGLNAGLTLLEEIWAIGEQQNMFPPHYACVSYQFMSVVNNQTLHSIQILSAL